MKTLLTLLAVLTLSICTVRADVASELAALKKEFPAYVGPGPKSKHDVNDPLARDCRDKYTKAIGAISPANLKQSAVYLKAQIAKDVERYEAIMAESTKASATTGKQFENARANAYWLKSKVAPFLDKLDALPN